MDKLLKILEDLHPGIDFATTPKLVDFRILDSFDLVTLIAEISETFDITIPAHEIIPANFNSVEAMYELIERLIDEN